MASPALAEALRAGHAGLAEALAGALTEFLSHEQTVRRAWSGGKAVERTVSVSTHAGPLEVTVRAPHPRESAGLEPPTT